MAGISSKALNGIAENKNRFNDGAELQNKEFSDGSGLEWYGTDYRSYDPQIGKFHQVDLLGELTESWSMYSYSLNNPVLYNDPFGLISTRYNGGQGYTGWIDPGNGGEIYFDPRVHSQDDLPDGAGTYLGEEIILTDQNGNPLGFGDDQGNILGNMPTGTNLPEITLTGRSSKSKNGSSGFWSKAGSWTRQKSSDFASAFVYVGTAVGSSVYNAANEIIHEGFHPGDAYDRTLYSGKVYKLDNWKFKVVIDYQNKSQMTDEESNELAMSTVNAVLTPIRVVPGINISKTVLINKVVTNGVNIATKTVLKTPIRTILE